jgi:hypothetical protein
VCHGDGFFSVGGLAGNLKTRLMGDKHAYRRTDQRVIVRDKYAANGLPVRCFSSIHKQLRKFQIATTDSSHWGLIGWSSRES